MTRPWRLFERGDDSHWGRWWWTTDRWLLGATVVLIAAGVVLQFGTSPAAAIRMRAAEASPYYFAIRQCVFATLGLGVVIGVSSLGPSGVRRLAFGVYVVTILLMMALPIMGHHSNGAARWVGFGAVKVQPSEFMKPALLVLVAWMCAEARTGEIPGRRIAFGLYLLAAVLLVMEPDYGQTVLITASFGAAFWVAGMPLAWILGLGAASVVGLGVAYNRVAYVHARVTDFLYPHVSEGLDQVQRAARAIAAGGALGRGPAEGTRKALIPDMHTDFAYSAAAEDYGLAFSLILIALFAALVIRGLYRATKVAGPFEQVAATSLFAMVGLQAFINMMVNLGLAPPKGMTLPFISYGGSSILSMCLTLGMALALSRRPSHSPVRPDADREGALG